MKFIKLSQRKMADLSDLEQYVDLDYSIHFSNLPKLGINPKSEYATPIAVCGYPLTSKIYDQLINKTLPFAQEKEYMHLYRIKDAFDVDSYDEEKYEEDLNKILELIEKNPEWNQKAFSKLFKSKSYSQFLDWIIKKDVEPASSEQDEELKDFSPSKEEKIKYLEDFGKTDRKPKPFSIMWNIGRLLCENSRKWNALLRALGYNSIVDYGNGILHPGEPFQTMVFNPSSIEYVKYYISPVRHGIAPEETIDKKINWVSKNFNSFKSLMEKNPSSMIKEEVARKSKIPEVLLELAQDEDEKVRSRVAKNPYINEKIQKSLIEDMRGTPVWRENILLYLARNPSLTEEAQKILVRNDSEHYVQIKRSISSNDSTTSNVLKELITTSNNHWLDDTIKQNVADHPNATSEIFEILAKDESVKVRAYLARGVEDKKILLQLAAEPEAEVKKHVFYNRKADEDVFRVLVADKSFSKEMIDIREKVISLTNDIELLKELASDPVGLIRLRARQKLEKLSTSIDSSTDNNKIAQLLQMINSFETKVKSIIKSGEAW